MTFLYSFFIWLSDLMPGNNVGFAIVLLALVTHVIAYFLTKRHVKIRMRHQFISHKVQRLVDRGHEYIQKIYEDFTFTPWKGFGISILTAIIFVFFFFVIQYTITTSPGDISNLAFRFSFLPQNLNYQFLGINILERSYSLWYVFVIGFLLFINLFLYVSDRWKFERQYGSKHIIEFLIIIGISVFFMLTLRTFMFAAIIYWGVHICLSLLLEILHHKHLAEDVHVAMESLGKRTAVEKKDAYMRLQNVLNKMFINSVAKNFKLTKAEATTRFHTHMQQIHHHEVIEGLRFQLVGQPYLIVLILIWLAGVV